MYVVNKKNLTFLYIGAYMLWKKNIRSKSITKCIYVSTYSDIILDIGHRYVEKSLAQFIIILFMTSKMCR